MFNKDTFRLIGKTKKRFFSLLLIVLIGASFMMGLFSTSTIMRQSVDAYDDEYNLQDIQLYSSYGFSQSDIDTINKLEYVENVSGSKTIDVYCINKYNDIKVSRIEEYDKQVNQYMLTSGRNPLYENECVMLTSTVNPTNYKLYDQITIYLEDDDIKDSIKNDKLTIVGFAKAPAYSSKTLGTSNLDNKELETVLYVNDSNFIVDYYTTIYLTFTGSKDTLSYTSQYDNYVEDLLERFESFASVQQEVRKEEVKQKYIEEIDEGKIELEKQKANGQKQLDNAKAQLDKANIQIVAGEVNIKQYEAMIEAAKSQAIAYNPFSDEEVNKLNEDIKQVEDKYNQKFDAAYENVGQDYATYISLRTIKENFSEITGQEAIEQVEKQMQDLDDKYNGSLEEEYNRLSEIELRKTEYQATQEAYNEANSLYLQLQEELEKSKVELEAGKKQYQAGLKKYNQSVALFNSEIAKGEAEINKAYQELDELPEAKWIILDRSKHYSSYMYVNTCNQMQAIGLAMPFLFYLVAALVCMTTMTRLIDEQRGQIGIFRALGFSNRQIIGKYLIYALLASLIGSIIGIIVGNIIFPTVIYETWRLMYDLPDMVLTYPIHFVIICIFAFAILMMAVTYFVCKKSLNESCASLMRPKAPKNAKKVFLEKISFIWDRLSFTGKITARNIIRYKSRFFMTVIGVAGCTGLLVIGWGVKDSIADIINIQFGNIFNYDYTILLDNDSQIDQIKEVLEDDLSNRYIVEYSSYSSMVYLDEDSEETINVNIMDARDSNNVLSLRKTDYKTPINLSNNGVIISQKFALNNNISKGDTITIESYNGVKGQVYVEDICEMYFQHYLFISDDYYQQIFNEKIFYTCIALTTDDIDSAYESIKDFETINSYVDFSSLIDTFQTMIKALDYIILVIIITAGSLAFVVLYNLTQVNLSERIREIATLKVLGFTDQEVESYLYKEIMLLTIIGGIIGLPLGVLEHHFIMNVINMDMVMFGMNISAISFAYAYGITIIFTVIVLLFTKKQLKQIQMVESLKSVE